MPSVGASIFNFISDDDFRSSLESDYDEMVRCLDACAWKAVHVLAGSIVEAVLIDYRVSEELIGQKQGLALDLGKAIGLARDHEITSARATDLSSVIRDYRNLIHPGRMKRLGDAVGAETARVAMAVVTIIAEEVSKRRLANYGYAAEQIASKLEMDSSASAIVSHLLRETKEREIERLLVKIPPERYLALLDDPFAPEHALESFVLCFRVALDNADDSLKTRVAKWFVWLLKEENDHVVFSYGTAFLRCKDLQYLGPNEQALVKDHLLSRMKAEVTPSLLTAIPGVGEWRWTPLLGQVGGRVKVEPAGVHYAALLSRSVKYA